MADDDHEVQLAYDGFTVFVGSEAEKIKAAALAIQAKINGVSLETIDLSVLSAEERIRLITSLGEVQEMNVFSAHPDPEEYSIDNPRTIEKLDIYEVSFVEKSIWPDGGGIAYTTEPKEDR